jgi:hypothetical protein
MRTALFGFSTPNLGDDLQSLAVALAIGRPDCYVNRDRLDQIRLDKRHRLIMNSWFAIKRYRALPPSDIEPIFFGFCVGRRELLNDAWLPYLQSHQPIGCRDEESATWLNEHGITAHMTGCITLWLGHRTALVPASQRSGIYMVDVPEEIEPAIPAHIRRQAIRLTNAPTRALRNGGQKDRMRHVAAISDKLRSAELVMTKRLHTILPCVSFGTPVIGLISAAEMHNKNSRFKGYEKFIALARHKDNKLIDFVDWNSRVPAIIPIEIQAHFDDLIRKLNNPDNRYFDSLTHAVSVLIPDDGMIPRHPRPLYTSARDLWSLRHLNLGGTP